MNKIIVIRNNEIINIGLPFPINNPLEGLQENGDYILYVNDESFGGASDHEVIERTYWDGYELIQRPPRPSSFCVWNANTLTWELNEVAFMYEIRRQRDSLLYRTDWTQLHDAPITVEQDEEATIYRQALRDITDPIIANPSAYVQIESAPWPTPPEWLNVS